VTATGPRINQQTAFTSGKNVLGAFCVFVAMVAFGLCTNGNDSTGSIARGLEQQPVALLHKPDPSENMQSAMESMATSVASVAIQVSLIPHDLLDRDGMERQIRGQLENQLGDGWTVEVTCYAGWCHIKLIHAIGEIWVEANDGLATKSIYLN